MTVQRTPFNVRCQPCGHVWTAAWLPMPLRDCASMLMGIRCPNCAGGAGSIFIASSAGPAAPAEAAE